MWKVEKIVSKGEYNYAICREHPNAIRHGYVLEHRIVMENHLGRLLYPTEVVHHLNGDKKDNRIENLEVMDRCYHARHHAMAQGKKMVELICPSCFKHFVREYRQTHLAKRGKATFCSRSCNGKFSRHKQLHGLTIQMKKAISGNVLREYREYSDNPEQTTDNGMRRDYTPLP